MSNEKIQYNMTDEALEQFATKLFEKVNARIEERIVTTISELSNDKQVASAKTVKVYVDEKLLNLNGAGPIILTDTLTGINYALTVENGTLSLVEYSNNDNEYTAFIITGDNRSLIGYEYNTTYLVIPETFTGEDDTKYKVIGIEQQAFRSTGLVSVSIPEGVTYIGAGSFNDCTTLNTVTLPSTITSIGNNAFLNTGIRTVNYRGTEEQWNNITIGSDNDPLKNATINYNYTSEE